jgi:hypothetical protein
MSAPDFKRSSMEGPQARRVGGVLKHIVGNVSASATTVEVVTPTLGVDPSLIKGERSEDK